MNRLLVISAARRRPLVAAAVALICGVVVVLAWSCGRTEQALGYLAAMAAAVVVTDLVAPPPDAAPPVRRPGLETMLAIGVCLLGTAALTWRFAGPPQGGFARLAFVVTALLFVFPIALSACLLFVLRYRPRELGLRLRGLACAPAVTAVVAAAAFAVAPENVLWGRMWNELGPWNFLVMEVADGLLGAALAEEFVRFVLQTRIGSLVRDPAVGWLVASIVWALLHVPKGAGESHDVAGAFAGAVMIVPLGLLWGYMTHRTGSFVPAMLVHAVNLWGLQNF